MTYLFIRTCQSCDGRINCPRPEGALKDTYLNRQCRKCRSIDFDFGSMRDVNPVTLEDLPKQEDLDEGEAE